MPSVMHTASGDAGVGRFHDRVGRERRRHEDHRRVGAGLLAPPRATVLNTGQPSWVVPPLPGVTPPTTVRAVGRGLLGVEGALAAGEALDDEAGAPVDQYGHCVL